MNKLAVFPTLFDLPVKFAGCPLDFKIAIDKSMLTAVEGAPQPLFFQRRYFNRNMVLTEVKSTQIGTQLYGGLVPLGLLDNLLHCYRFVEISVTGEFAELPGSCDVGSYFPGEDDGGDFDDWDFDGTDFWALPASTVPPDGLTYFTEQKLIRLDRDCYENSLYLRWLNGRNNLEGWLFTGEKDLELDVFESFSRRTDDLRKERTLLRAASQKMKVRTGRLTKGQVEAIRTLFVSPYVAMQDGAGNLTQVAVQGSSFKLWQESARRYTLEFDLLLNYENSILG